MWQRLCGAILAALVTLSGAEAADYELLRLEGRYVKWGEPAFGAGAALTYSFATRRQSFPDAINCKELAPLDGLLRHSAIPGERLKEEVRAAFDMWEAVADLSFRYVADPDEADILIGAQARPRGIAYANVEPTEAKAGARTDADAIAGIRQALVCLNPLVPWEAILDGSEATFNIGHVVAHEIGHTIGLDHPGRHGQLMGFDYSERSPGLKAGDIAGAVRLYGPRRNPDTE